MSTGGTARLYCQAPGQGAIGADIDLAAALDAGPRVSCIMATRGRAFPARHAIACFRAQSYADRELVIACVEADSEVERLVAETADPRIRFVPAPGAATVGDIRNAAIAQASGALLCVWDDDDLAHPCRIAWQVAALVQAGAPCCLLSQVLLWWPARRRLAISGPRIWENSLLAGREVMPAYVSQPRGSDTILVDRIRSAHPLAMLAAPLAYCYVVHGGNLWGEAHFDMLFAAGTRRYEGEEHDATIAALATTLPFGAYDRDRRGDLTHA